MKKWKVTIQLITGYTGGGSEILRDVVIDNIEAKDEREAENKAMAQEKSLLSVFNVRAEEIN